MQGTPLSKNFCVGSGVRNLIVSNPCTFIAGDVPNAVAAGLDAVHINACEQVHHIGAPLEWDPVVLNVLTCREMGDTFDQSGGRARAD